MIDRKHPDYIAGYAYAKEYKKTHKTLPAKFVVKTANKMSNIGHSYYHYYTGLQEAIRVKPFEETFEKNKKNSKCFLSAKLEGVTLSAHCVTEEHRNDTLAHWKKLNATDITIKEGV